jgi:hypothetical protein
LISFLFYTPQGVLITSPGFFDGVMTVTGTLLGAILLLKYLSKFTVDYLKESIQVGVVWILMSIVLDLIVLVPFAKMNLVSYFMDVAFGYLAIPIMAIFAGLLLENKADHSKKIFSQVASTKK